MFPKYCHKDIYHIEVVETLRIIEMMSILMISRLVEDSASNIAVSVSALLESN